MKKKVLLTVGLIVLIGCGGGGGGGIKTDPKDVAEIAKNPTGTLTQDNVDDVINEFLTLLNAEESIPSISGLSPQTEYCSGGICCDVSENSAKCDCPVSGNFSVKIDSQCQNDCTMEYSYNNCAFDEECAVDGDGAIWMGSLMGGEMAFTFSGLVCDVPVDVAYYFDGTDFWYVVEVNGETFAVKGYYSNGYGEITIKDSKGEYYCIIENDVATCEGL